jgi:hypothetical protein
VQAIARQIKIAPNRIHFLTRFVGCKIAHFCSETKFLHV